METGIRLKLNKRATCVAALTMASMLCGCRGYSPPESSLRPEADRKAAPDFVLKDMDGASVRLSDYRGKVVLLNFWATWCAPCRLEIPWFVDFEQRFKNSGFSVVGVSMDEEGASVVRPFLSEMGVNYRTLLGDSIVAELYGGVNSLPTSLLIDRQGRIASAHLGLVHRTAHEAEIKELLAEASSGAVK
jgi:cytochrome c biogenesis protein CcmG/thiol:disulfide interchange protein DsbE